MQRATIYRLALLWLLTSHTLWVNGLQNLTGYLFTPALRKAFPTKAAEINGIVGTLSSAMFAFAIAAAVVGDVARKSRGTILFVGALTAVAGALLVIVFAHFSWLILIIGKLALSVGSAVTTTLAVCLVPRSDQNAAARFMVLSQFDDTVSSVFLTLSMMLKLPSWLVMTVLASTVPILLPLQVIAIHKKFSEPVVRKASPPSGTPNTPRSDSIFEITNSQKARPKVKVPSFGWGAYKDFALVCAAIPIFTWSGNCGDDAFLMHDLLHVNVDDVARYSSVTGICSSIVSLVFAVISGMLREKFSNRPVLIAGCLISAGTNFAWLMIPNFWWSIPVTLVGAIGNGLTNPLLMAMVFDTMPSKLRCGRYIACLEVLGVSGAILGEQASGWLLKPFLYFPSARTGENPVPAYSWWGYFTVYTLGSVLSLLCIVLVSLVNFPRARESQKKNDDAILQAEHDAETPDPEVSPLLSSEPDASSPLCPTIQ